MEIIKNTILIKYPMIFSKKMKDTISYFEWNILSELVVQANYIVDTFNMWSADIQELKEHKVETRQVGDTIITYESGVVVSMSSDNVVESIEYDVNGKVEKVTSTYADGKVYEETYTKDVNGNITKIMKVEIL